MSSAEQILQESVETDLAPVGFSRIGSGPPVLIVHGFPGGTDSSLAMGRFLVEAGFELIAPARPGYPGTELKGRETIDDQADLHAALLDALGIGQAAVITWSGGGPSGYRLAVRHRGKVSVLTGFASVSQRYTPPKEGLDERLIENTSAGNWLLRLLADHAPKSTVSSTLAAEGDLTRSELKTLVAEAMDEEAEKDVVLTMARVVADHSNRAEWLENDMAKLGEIEDLELEKITAPSLIIHGTADVDVTRTMATTLPGQFLAPSSCRWTRALTSRSSFTPRRKPHRDVCSSISAEAGRGHFRYLTSSISIPSGLIAPMPPSMARILAT